MMQDLAYSFQCEPRSLEDLQSLVLAGKFGNQPGQLKPLDNLLVEQLREELTTRGFDTTGKLKPTLQNELTLLTLNPIQTLQSLNLHEYEILDCEPLHDFKGHAYNLLTEVPTLFESPLKEEIKTLIETTAPKQKVTGVLLRTATIKLYLKLLKLHQVDKTVITLIGTLVKISEILYAQHFCRTPRIVLQFYNVTWTHHELCCELLPNPKHQTRDKLFGIYLHDLVSHGPPQYQLMCLRSANAESTERLFSQIKHISLKATNRQPDNVLTTVLLSMQAKEMTNTNNSHQSDESMVSKLAKKVPTYKGTVISKSFIQCRLQSWQAHLERISPYLEFGEGVWWKAEGDGYIFFDSDKGLDYDVHGPKLMHFRNATSNKCIIRARQSGHKLQNKKQYFQHHTFGSLRKVCTMADVIFLVVLMSQKQYHNIPHQKISSIQV